MLTPEILFVLTPTEDSLNPTEESLLVLRNSVAGPQDSLKPYKDNLNLIKSVGPCHGVGAWEQVVPPCSKPTEAKR